MIIGDRTVCKKDGKVLEAVACSKNTCKNCYLDEEGGPCSLLISEFSIQGGRVGCSGPGHALKGYFVLKEIN